MIPAANVTTALELPGHRITQSLGIVRGIIVRSRGIGGNFVGQLLTIFGGNNIIYSNLCEDARQHAYDLMIRHGEEKGANAIVGFHYDATEVMPGLTEVLAYGTAVKVEKTND